MSASRGLVLFVREAWLLIAAIVALVAVSLGGLTWYLFMGAIANDQRALLAFTYQPAIIVALTKASFDPDAERWIRQGQCNHWIGERCFQVEISEATQREPAKLAVLIRTVASPCEVLRMPDAVDILERWEQRQADRLRLQMSNPNATTRGAVSRDRIQRDVAMGAERCWRNSSSRSNDLKIHLNFVTVSGRDSNPAIR